MTTGTVAQPSCAQSEPGRRLSKAPSNAYVDRFQTLLTESTKRFRAHEAGEDLEPDASAFGKDIRRHRDALLAAIRAATDLPAMPQVVEKLDRVLSDPDASIKEVVEVVSVDGAIAARIMKIVNSPMFGIGRDIERLDQAVSLLGMRGVRHVVVTASVLGTFTAKERELFSPRRFWQHSLAVATGASLIAKTLTEKNDTESVDAEQAFLAGLLHDVGKMLIAHRHWEQYVQVCKLSDGQGMSRLDAEMTVFGLQHTDFGFELLQHWGLPETVCGAALSHHEPATKGTFVYVVHLADAIAHGLGFSPDFDQFPRLDPRVWAELDLSDRVIERIGYDVLCRVAEAGSILE